MQKFKEKGAPEYIYQNELDKLALSRIFVTVSNGYKFRIRNLAKRTCVIFIDFT